jgi:hypothetical protein
MNSRVNRELKTFSFFADFLVSIQASLLTVKRIYGIAENSQAYLHWLIYNIILNKFLPLPPPPLDSTELRETAMTKM